MRDLRRGCGGQHTGICWTERFASWSRPGAWIPPEYRDGTWYRLTEEGRVPLPCRPLITGSHPRRDGATFPLHD
jgi:hypothetical protein